MYMSRIIDWFLNRSQTAPNSTSTLSPLICLGKGTRIKGFYSSLDISLFALSLVSLNSTSAEVALEYPLGLLSCLSKYSWPIVTSLLVKTVACLRVSPLFPFFRNSPIRILVWIFHYDMTDCLFLWSTLWTFSTVPSIQLVGAFTMTCAHTVYFLTMWNVGDLILQTVYRIEYFNLACCWYSSFCPLTFYTVFPRPFSESFWYRGS